MVVRGAGQVCCTVGGGDVVACRLGRLGRLGCDGTAHIVGDDDVAIALMWQLTCGG